MMHLHRDIRLELEMIIGDRGLLLCVCLLCAKFKNIIWCRFKLGIRKDEQTVSEGTGYYVWPAGLPVE